MIKTIKEKIVKIRKPHRCWGCADLHEKGDVMEVIVVSFDEYITRSYWCKPCLDFWATLKPWELEDGIQMGQLNDYDEYKEFKEKHRQFILGDITKKKKNYDITAE